MHSKIMLGFSVVAAVGGMFAASCGGDGNGLIIGDTDDEECPISAYGLHDLPFEPEVCENGSFRIQVFDMFTNRGDIDDDAVYAVRGWLTAGEEESDEGTIDEWIVALWVPCARDLTTCEDKVEAGTDEPFDVQLRIVDSNCDDATAEEGLLIQVYPDGAEIGADEPRLSCPFGMR